MKPSPSIETGVIAAPLTVVESMVLLHTEVNGSIGKRPYLVSPAKSSGWAKEDALRLAARVKIRVLMSR